MVAGEKISAKAWVNGIEYAVEKTIRELAEEMERNRGLGVVQHSEAVEDDMDINGRLEKLERENRRMKKIGIVAGRCRVGGHHRWASPTIPHRRWNNPDVNTTI